MASLEEVCGDLRALGERGADEATRRKFRKTVESYQERAGLLDPHLDALLAPLVGHLRLTAARLASHGAAPAAEVQPGLVLALFSTSHLIWTAASVRGPKVVAQFFPPTPADVRVAALLLDRLTALGDNPSCSPEREAGQLWEVQCVALLWMSQLALLPFNLFRGQAPALSSAQQMRQDEDIHRVLWICKQHLDSPSACQGVAGFLLGRLLCRPDAAAPLADFLQWAGGVLGLPGRRQVFLTPGVLRALSYVMKNAQNTAILEGLPKVWSAVMSVLQGDNQGHTLTRKLAVKALQHTALAFLAAPGPADKATMLRLEQALELLLKSMADSDTIVRWAAAKGLARIASRVAEDAAAQIVQQVLLALEAAQSESAWHGGCLTLAELARRRLLPPERFDRVCSVIRSALELDIRRGSHSTGANVRDAAAYLCWALARAYATDDIRPLLQALAPSMLSAMCFDREVNCRRAVAAALQECIGRHDCLPNGIEVSAAADYFALSSRTSAYLEVAPQLEQLTEHGPVLRRQLLEVKLRHWDLSVRSLASKALAAFVAQSTRCWVAPALDFLLPLWTSPSLETSHGAVLGAAELLAACTAAQQEVATETRAAMVAALAPLLSFQGHAAEGREHLRAATCRLVECVACAGVEMTPAGIDACQAYLLQSLQCVDPAVQEQAGLAFAALSHRHTDHLRGNSVQDSLVRGLRDARQDTRRASAVALGLLCPEVVRPRKAELLARLAEAIKAASGAQETESKAAAVTALARLTREQLRLLGSTNERCAEAYLRLVQREAIDAMLVACQDYSLDKRGDVGSWVREAALEALTQTISAMLFVRRSIVGDSLAGVIHAAVGVMLQQAVERISKVQKVALEQLDNLLQAISGCATIAAEKQLQAVSSAAALSSPIQIIERVGALLSVDTYRRAILKGLIYSLGGLDSSLAAGAGEQLRRQLSSDRAALDIWTALIELWEGNQHSKRLGLGFLRAAELLLLDHAALLQAASVAGKTAALLRAEIIGLRGVGKLNAAVQVLGRLTHGIPLVRAAAMSSLADLLVCSLPTVRQHAAETLYLHLLRTGASEAGMSLLLMTSWAASLSKAQSASAQFARHLAAIAAP